MSPYRILDGDPREAGPLIAGADEPLEPLDWLSGAWRALPERPLELRLSPGDTAWPDLATYLVPLISDRLRDLLEREHVDNIQYRRVALRDHRGRTVGACWIANVLGLVATAARGPSPQPDFAIDAACADGARLFRPAAHPHLLLVDAALAALLRAAQFRGVRLRPLEARDDA